MQVCFIFVEDAAVEDELQKQEFEEFHVSKGT